MDILTIKHALLEFGVTQAQIGAYAGLSAARMSRGLASELNGEAPFTESELQMLQDTIDAMRHLRDSTPLPIAWEKTAKVKSFVDQSRTALLEDRDPRAQLRQWYIRLNSLQFLKHVQNNEVVPTINPERDGAAFEDSTLADEAVRRLFTLGVTGRTELLTVERRKSTIIGSLEQLGLSTEGVTNVSGS